MASTISHVSFELFWVSLSTSTTSSDSFTSFSSLNYSFRTNQASPCLIIMANGDGRRAQGTFSGFLWKSQEVAFDASRRIRPQNPPPCAWKHVIQNTQKTNRVERKKEVQSNCMDWRNVYVKQTNDWPGLIEESKHNFIRSHSMQSENN